MDMDTSKMLEIDFRVTVIQIARMENNINGNINSLRAGLRVDLAEHKNATNEIQSNLDTLTARVNEAEDQISDLEDKLIEKKDQEEAWNT